MSSTMIFIARLIISAVFIVHLNCLMVDAIFEEGRELLSGKVIRVGVIDYPPPMTITKNPDGTTTYTGTAFDIIDQWAKHLNFTFKYVPINLGKLLRVGLVGVQVAHIVDNEVDLSAIGIDSLSHALYQKIDFSVACIQWPYRLVVPWPKEETRLLAPIRPFQPLVWLSLGLTLIALAPTLQAISGLYLRYVDPNNRHNRAHQAIVDFAGLLYNGTFLLSHLTNQGFRYDLRLRSRGSFILVGVWVLMTVVLANGYAGTLFSFITVAKLKQPINSIEELANNYPDVKLLIQGQTNLATRFTNATSGPEKVIGDSLRNNPETLFSFPSQAIKLMMSGKYAFTFYDNLNFPVMDATYKLAGKKCVATLAKKEVISFAPVVFAYAKNGPYSKALNEQMQAQIDAGIVDHIVKRVMPNVDQCKMENQQPDTRARPLNLMDMASSFIILGIGISLSTLLFLIELVFKQIQNHF